jgi:hemerythrin
LGAPNRQNIIVFWTEQFETGVSKLDLQHWMLINNINHLEEMLENTNPIHEECNFLIHLVGFLESYAEMHFKIEEQCMESCRCPAYKQNKEAHQQYRDFFCGFKRRYPAEGFRPQVLKELHEAASKWIEIHILQVDTQLRLCAKAAGQTI